MATMDHDTDSTDCDMQNTIARALSRLNKQRIYQFNIAAEGQEDNNLGTVRKIQDAQQAQEAVVALRKVVLLQAILRLC